MPSSTTVEAPPSRLGSYRVCLEIAAGGMATVYLARSAARVGPDRFVALKVAHPHLVKDPSFVAMFGDEARIISRICHPNVCRILDFEASGRSLFLVMEHLSGENLASVYARTAASPPTGSARTRHALFVARVIADAAAGLHAAHELTDDDGAPLHVVHRDVSPENIFLTYDGVVKIVDFGVAQDSRQRHHTAAGFVKGKIAYLQPEAIHGCRLDRRADVWGLGVTLWELLTGQRLFRRESDVETIRAIDELEIRPPSELCPGLPKELDSVVMRALEREPANRYPTARALGHDLLTALARLRYAVELADLAEWMHSLYPGAIERRRKLLVLAERLAAEGEALEARELEGEQTGRRSLSPSAPTRIVWPSEPPTLSEPPKRRGIGIAAALFIGATVGGLSSWMMGHAVASPPTPVAQVRAPVEAAVLAPTPPVTPGSSETPALSVTPGSPATSGSSATPARAPHSRRVRVVTEGALSGLEPYTLEIGEDTTELILRIERGSAGGPAQIKAVPAP